jgi:RNA polymerase-binding transcription factor DksA
MATRTPKTTAGKTSRKTVSAPEIDNNGTEALPVAEVVTTLPPASQATPRRADLDMSHFRDRLFEEMAKLEEEREYMRRSAGDMDGNMPEDPESDEDTADLASSLMDKEMDMTVEDQIEETLGAIEHALKKMEDGTYGICDVSGEPIPAARLELLPWASLTAQMQVDGRRRIIPFRRRKKPKTPREGAGFLCL